MPIEDVLVTVVTNTGFAGVAFYLMYQFATKSVAELSKSLQDNTVVLGQLKTLIEQIMRELEPKRVD